MSLRPDEGHKPTLGPSAVGKVSTPGTTYPFTAEKVPGRQGGARGGEGRQSDAERFPTHTGSSGKRVVRSLQGSETLSNYLTVWEARGVPRRGWDSSSLRRSLALKKRSCRAPAAASRARRHPLGSRGSAIHRRFDSARATSPPRTGPMAREPQTAPTGPKGAV